MPSDAWAVTPEGDISLFMDEDEQHCADAWVCEQMICNRCGHEWVAVYPFALTEAECSQCGYMQPTGADTTCH